MVSDSFREYIMEQLGGVEGLRAKSMFGGLGLYSNNKFFGVVDDDRVFFKVSFETIQDYLVFGSRPFEPSPGQILKSYYEVPPEIIEDRNLFADWADKSINITK